MAKRLLHSIVPCNRAAARPVGKRLCFPTCLCVRSIAAVFHVVKDLARVVEAITTDETCGGVSLLAPELVA